MKFFVFTIFAALSIFRLEAQLQCPADKEEEWTYRGLKGPWLWGEKYPMCYGKEQSPIEIDSESAVKDENLAQLTLNNYETPVSQATIENNGHTIKVVPNDDVQRSISVNEDTYNLHQFHFHWGGTYSEGSEHILDDVQYAMEMHLVHMNGDGKLAVVGVFFQEGDETNEELKAIVDQLPNLRFKNSKAELNSELNLNNLIPSNPTSFFRYEGSLTTPGCSEGVTWSVVPQPMKVGETQMAEFRKLSTATKDKATTGCTMSGNYRPVQLLNERQVFLSQ